MAGRKSDFTLTKLDDLFSTQEQRDEEKLSKIRDIPLTEIDDFPDHPFKVRDDEDRLADIQERIEAEQVRYEPAHEVHKTMAEIEEMGQKTLTGKIAVSKDDYQQLTALAKEGITSRSEIQDLKSSVSYYQRQYFNASSAVERLQERYDQLKEKCQPFLQALEHFPKLVEVFAEKVKELFSIKEAQERKEREDRAAARKEQSKHRRGRNDWER